MSPFQRKTLFFCGAISFLSAASPLLCAEATPSPTPTSPTPKEVPFDFDLYKKFTVARFVTLEYLYWVVNEGAVDYAVKMKKPAWSSVQKTCAVGDYKSARFDWASGFRVALGFFNAPRYWDLFGQYTFVPANGNNEVHAPKEAAEFLNGTWIQPDVNTATPPTALQRVRSHINFKYHLFDFLFSRRFHPNEHFRLNIFGGLTSAFIYQKWNVFYKDLFDQQSKIRNNWQFEGVGLRMGLKIDWFMRYNIYLTGLMSTGILSGWYKNSAFQKTNALIADANNSRPFRNTHFHDSRLVYTAQFMAGPSWQKSYKGGRIELMTGYELTIWTNLHEIYRSTFDAPTAAKETFINNSNVSLQGLTVRFNLDF